MTQPGQHLGLGPAGHIVRAAAPVRSNPGGQRFRQQPEHGGQVGLRIDRQRTYGVSEKPRTEVDPDSGRPGLYCPVASRLNDAPGPWRSDELQLQCHRSPFTIDAGATSLRR